MKEKKKKKKRRKSEKPKFPKKAHQKPSLSKMIADWSGRFGNSSFFGGKV